MEAAAVSASISMIKKLVLACSLPDSLRRPPDVEVQALEQDLDDLRSSVLELSKEDQDDSTSSTLCMSLMNQLRELCYDAEDYLDMVQHSRGGCSWQINWMLSKAKRHRPPLSAKDISDLRSRVKPTKEIAHAYKTASSRTSNKNGPRPQEEPDCRPNQEQDSPHVVYSDDSLQPDDHNEPISEVVRLLALESDQQLKTVAIHGSAGIGKTTLARRLFRDYEGRFHFGAFLRVSSNQDTRRLLASILLKIKGQGCRYWGFEDEQDLIQNIRHHLQGKSYFIVIDDLRATSVWDFLSRAFPKDNCGSRIITTTQVMEVALAFCNNHAEDIFNMEPLNVDQSLQLFNSRVKQIKDCNAEQLGEISDGIIRKCGHRLPLAIINIAGMLAGWPDFNKDDWEYVRKCLFCTMTANLTMEEAMEGFLNLMYNNLPTKLKTCLLYLSIYPEGSVIRKDDLVRQWVAEGIFSQVEWKGREHEVGFIYFDELLKRGLIQPVDTDNNNQVLSCIVHQVVLSFITKKSMQENFITVVDYRETATGLHDNKVHRLSVRFESAKHAQIPGSFRVCHVRTFMFSGFFKSVPSLVKYWLLRVLILHVWSDQDKHVLELSPIGNMFQLRYLKVQCNMIVKLPVMIRGLRHLQTLEVDANTVLVPYDVFSLKSLLHLCLPSKTYLPGLDIHHSLAFVISLGRELRTLLLHLREHQLRSVLGTLFSTGYGFGNLTSLRSLGYFDLSTCSRGTVSQLGELTNLQDLHLTCSAVRNRHRDNNIKCLASVLGKCTNLKSLIIRGEGSSKQSISFDGLISLLPPQGEKNAGPCSNIERFVLSPKIFKMSRLPEWIAGRSKLHTLKIAVEQLSSGDVGILQELSVLTALSLYVRRTPTNETRIMFSGGFQALKYFKFTCIALCVQFSQGAMPAVQRLNVCFNANTMQKYRPEEAGIGHLSGLKVISAKLAAASTDQASREAAKTRLVDAILSNHPSLRCLQENHLQSHCLEENHPKPPIRNVQLVDWVIHGDTEQCSTDVMIPEDSSSLHREHGRPFLSEFPFTRRALFPSIFTRLGRDERRIEENDVAEDIITRESSSLMPKPGWVTIRPRTGIRLVKTVRGFTYMVRQHMKQPGFEVMNEMTSINQEMRRMTIMTDSNPGLEPTEWVRQVQDLAYDVQDFTDIYRWLRIKSRRHSLAHMSHIVQLKDRIRNLREWQQSSTTSQQDSGSGAALCYPQSSGPYAPEDVLVGMDQPRNELLKLIFEREVMDEHVSPWLRKEQKPRVISIVGYSGIGKTALARAVYYDPYVRSAFNCTAWVVASECGHGGDLLNKICLQIKEQVSGVVSDFYMLKEMLLSKRFLLVIDDLRAAGMWYDIHGVFSESRNGNRSRIIVTTGIQSVATTCTPVPRYIYRMRGLDYLDSEKLLWMRVGTQANRTPALDYSLGDTLKKCGGLPLAVLSVANHLCQKEQNPQQGAFEEMDRVLTRCYDSLPDNAYRMCLLSLSTFPQGQLIKRKRLIRRWIAEGLAVGDGILSAEQVASNIFDVLIDRNIIEPVLIGRDSKVKACLVLGVIKDFITKISVSKDIVTIIQNDELLFPNRMIAHPVRRIVVHGGTKHSEGVAKVIGLDQVRSLTICNTLPFDFQGCWLVRVLDMESCWGVDKRVLGNICKLVFLKYLSLRGTDVYKMSKKIKKLEYLETLDLRDTRVEALPIEVFMLPHLVHLFGKFELPRQLKHQIKSSRLQAFFSEKSRLQTLSGFVMVNSNRFEHMMINIRSLRKVKMWCNHSISSNQEHHMAYSLQKRLVGNNTLESLSIDFGNESINFLNDIGAPHAIIGSMKLHGRLTSLPSFMTSYDTTLSQLQLSSTGLGIQALSLLQNLRRLIFLKLIQDGDGFWGDCFVVKKDGFPSLLRLCIEAREIPQLHIHEGGMSSLTCLELLCPMFPSFNYSDMGEIYVETNSEKRSKEVHSVEKFKAVDPQRSFTEKSSDISSKVPEIEEAGTSKWSKEVDSSISFSEVLPENKIIINDSEKTKRIFDLNEHFKGMENLQHLNELFLHPSVSPEILDAWKEQASSHINRPRVTRQCTSALSLGRGPGTTNHQEEGQHRSKVTQIRGSETAIHEKAEEYSLGMMSHEKAGFQDQTSGKKIQGEIQQQPDEQLEVAKRLRQMDSLHHLAKRIQVMIHVLTQKMMLHKGLVNHNYEYIRGEMRMVAAYIGEGLSQNSQLVPPEKWVLQLQDLVYDIEDFVDMYNYVSVRSRIHALAHLNHIEDLKVRIESLDRQRRVEYIQSTKSSKREDSTSLFNAVTRSNLLIIGTDVPICELLELVCQEEFNVMGRVISIVGCPGVGKSTLTKSLRDQELIWKTFKAFIWVSASECRSTEDLLNKVIQQVFYVHPPKTREDNDMDRFQNILAQNRLLIVIDDLREIGCWFPVWSVFATTSTSSQIIVTTSIQSVAATCSQGSRNIYRMRGLGHLESQNLFLRTAYGDAYPILTPVMADALEEASRRCDGLPLALISAAHVWREQVQGCAQKFGSHRPAALPLGAFEELNRALSRWYQSLEDATYVLSLGIFPNGHSIKRNSLIRRWIAEGLVQEHHDHEELSAEKVGDQRVEEHHDHEELSAEKVGDQRVEERHDHEELSAEKVGDQRVEEHHYHEELSAKKVGDQRVEERHDHEELSAEKVGDQRVEERHDHRKLSAEQVGDQRFDELINQSIMEPVLTGSINSKVKRCRLRGPVLEFIVKESVSKNMVTLLHGDEPLHRGRSPHPVRVLSVHQTTEISGGRVATEIGFDRIRSLTIFNNGMAFDFQQCTYLRVLDLECCKGVDDRIVAGICKLKLLKYLSLRGSDVQEIPKEIEKLECLETLDIRETEVNKLPMQVLTLPRLVHLFGQFEFLGQELQDWNKRSELVRFFREESKLQTLSGLIMVDGNGYEHIVLYMRLLRKIKIWCQDSQVPMPILVSALQKRLTGNNALESLSIDFGDIYAGYAMGMAVDHYLNSMEDSAPCMLRSIKLRGMLPGRLPRFITSPDNYVTELQLSCTRLPLEELSVLQRLRRLLYLKLAEDDDGFPDGTLYVDTDGFPSLERLCFEAPKLPRLDFAEGAMPALTSLHLLCPQTSSRDEWEMKYDMIRIERLRNLNEVVLHSSTGDEELDFWKERARMHMNRPRVTRMPYQKSAWGARA